MLMFTITISEHNKGTKQQNVWYLIIPFNLIKTGFILGIKSGTIKHYFK